MNFEKAFDKAKTISDINEIKGVLYDPFGFDRQKAIQIIEKHHFTDWNVMIADFILNVNCDTLQSADNYQIARYLWIIEIYLNGKLLESKDEKGA